MFLGKHNKLVIAAEVQALITRLCLPVIKLSFIYVSITGHHRLCQQPGNDRAVLYHKYRVFMNVRLKKEAQKKEESPFIWVIIRYISVVGMNMSSYL